MIAMSLAEIAAVTGGTVCDGDPSLCVDGPVGVDSRGELGGGLFVAIAGQLVDGHDFATAAVQSGATAVLAARPVGVPAVVTADPIVALGRLARSVLDRLADCCVVAITGSQGKTTTKDLLAGVLERQGATVAPIGSHNNEIGVPLTVLRADASTRYLVVEMGARGGGQIGYLCDVAPPDIAVVLNVGFAHIGEFGGREQIAAAKAELVAALPPEGLAVLNADDRLVRAMAGETTARVLTFGKDAGAEVRASDVTLDEQGRAGFRLTVGETHAPVRLGLVGEHQVYNATAAAAAALGCGVALDVVASLLAGGTARSPWRMEVHRRADGVTVVNDAYNANPSSMEAALHTLRALGSSAPAGSRTVAVLGEMLELGQTARLEHQAVGRLVRALGISQVVAVGAGAEPIYRAARDAGASTADEAHWVPDVAAALAALRDRLSPGDVVLVKASRAAGLERVAEGLLGAVNQR